MSEPQKKENQGKGPSAFPQVLDGAREVVHSAIEHALTHGVAHAAEHAGEALIHFLRAPYPGTCLLRPHSVWLWRAGGVLETGGKILGHKAFGIVTEMFKENHDREYSGKEERRDLEEDKREARIAAMREPKVEQGIAYKNGFVYFPISRQWILPRQVIRASHPKHSSSHSSHTPHAHGALQVHVEVAGRLNSLPSAMGLSVHRPAHLPGNHIMIKATPISMERGASGHGERLGRLGNLVDLFLSACVAGR